MESPNSYICTVKFYMLKKYAWSLLLILMCSLSVFAKKDNGKIYGYWINEKKDLVIFIYENEENVVRGRIVWMSDSLDEYKTPLRDVMNNEAKLRSRKLVGLNILEDYRFDRDGNEWEGGKIYNFENGNTYRGRMWINSEGELRVRGHWWILWFLSRTKTWSRAISPELMDVIVRKK